MLTATNDMQKSHQDDLIYLHIYIHVSVWTHTWGVWIPKFTPHPHPPHIISNVTRSHCQAHWLWYLLPYKLVKFVRLLQSLLGYCKVIVKLTRLLWSMLWEVYLTLICKTFGRSNFLWRPFEILRPNLSTTMYFVHSALQFMCGPLMILVEESVNRIKTIL